MLKAKLSKAQPLKKIIDSIRDTLNETTLTCNVEGITLRSMDSGHVSLVSMMLRAESFETYECEGPAVLLGISLVSLGKVLKCVENDDTIILGYSSTSDTLDVSVESGNNVSNFELKLMDIDQEGFEIPESIYAMSISLVSTEFQKIIRNLQTFSDTCTIKIIEEKLIFSANGDSGNIEIIIGDAQIIRNDGEDGPQVNAGVSYSFSLNHLSMFTKATSLSERVVLSLTTDMPLSVDYLFKTEEQDNGDPFSYLKFYLAPKMELY